MTSVPLHDLEAGESTALLFKFSARFDVHQPEVSGTDQGMGRDGFAARLFFLLLGCGHRNVT